MPKVMNSLSDLHFLKGVTLNYNKLKIQIAFILGSQFGLSKTSLSPTNKNGTHQHNSKKLTVPQTSFSFFYRTNTSRESAFGNITKIPHQIATILHQRRKWFL